MPSPWLELIAQVPAGAAEEAAARLIEAGASAVEERPGPPGTLLLLTHFRMEPGATERLRAAEAALSAMGLGKEALTLRQAEDQNWVEKTRGFFTAQPIGERLWLRPPWENTPPPPGRAEVVIDPGMAFGTGWHPSTRLCLQAIDRLCAERPPARFLDVGCGSGILAMAALRLGAGEALALDLDPVAVESTLTAARMNGLEGRLRAGLGTLEVALLGDWAGRVELLAANIFLTPLRELMPRFAQALAPPGNGQGGRGVLSGIGYEQADALAQAAEGAGLRVLRRERLEEWAALEVERP